MPAITRVSDKPYRWKITAAPLDPGGQRREDAAAGLHHAATATASPTKARAYLAPLIRGEDPPPYKDGLPQYVRLKNVAVPKKLADRIQGIDVPSPAPGAPALRAAHGDASGCQCASTPPPGWQIARLPGPTGWVAAGRAGREARQAARAVGGPAEIAPGCRANAGPVEGAAGREPSLAAFTGRSASCPFPQGSSSRSSARSSRSPTACGRSAGSSPSRPATRACRRSPQRSRRAPRPTSTASTRRSASWA